MHKVLTQLGYMFPIPIPEVVIKGISPRSWAHFLHTRCYWIDICPATFRGFTVSASNMWGKIERIGNLAMRCVSQEVEFRNKKLDGHLVMQKVIVAREFDHPLPEVLALLASNIIRHDQC